MTDPQSLDMEILWRAISSEVKGLSDCTGETAVAAVLSGTDIRYAGESELWAPRPFWKAAMGQALVAALARDLRRSLIGKIDATELFGVGAGNHEAFSAHLDLVQARGYAIEINGGSNGSAAVAAPVVDRRGFPVAAIGIEGLTPCWTREMLHELGAKLVEATRGPSRIVGGAPRPASSAPRPAAPPSAAASVLAKTHNLIGESPVYDAANDGLFWIDMYDPAIFRLEKKSGQQHRLPLHEMVTAIALHPEGMLMAAASGVWLIDPVSGARSRYFGHPEQDRPSNRLNDGKCDSKGRFWVNTLDSSFAPDAGSLYRMDSSGSFEIMDTGLSVPNGIGWSPDNRTMYLADTAARTIYAYDFDEMAGSVANRRVLVRLPAESPGSPDGLTVDAHGNIWAAIFDGWRISQYSPEGVLTKEIVMPIPRPTSCVLDGRHERLFVTSARIRVGVEMLKDAPESGSAFEVQL